MHRFYIDVTGFSVGQTLELPADSLRHLRTVLRQPVGAECELYNGAGWLARASILADYTVQIHAVSQAPKPACSLTLIQGLPKGEKLELVLQKGTELGVGRFLPTRMQRSVGQLKPERERKRLERWQKIIREAARQSRQPYLPQLQVEYDLESAMAAVDADVKLLLWEEHSRSLDQLLPADPPQSIVVIVGPEGGITPEEAALAEQAGYQAASLGPRILRTETAGLAIMAILQYLYGDLTLTRYGDNADLHGKDES